MALCYWETGVLSPHLSAVPQPRRHGELLASVDSPVELPKCRGQKRFLTEKYDLSWVERSKPKFDDGLDA